MSEEVKDYILYNDDKIVIINKPAGIPSVHDTSGDPSIQKMLEDKFKRPLFPIHRLDRPVSGIQFFAKKAKEAGRFTSFFQNNSRAKQYYAIVNSPISKSEAKLENYLIHNPKTHKAYILEQKKSKAKKAVLTYKRIAESDRYTLLNVIPETGRFHQIRAQLAHQDMPIKGDVKYGSRRRNKDRSIHLHAYFLELQNDFCKISIKVAPPLKDSLWTAFTEINPLLLEQEIHVDYL